MMEMLDLKDNTIACVYLQTVVGDCLGDLTEFLADVLITE